MSVITPHASYPVLTTATVIRQAEAELISEPTGLASTVEVYRGYYNDIIKNGDLKLTSGQTISRAYRSSHPDFPSLLAFGVKMKRGVGILNGTLTIEYRGLDPALLYPPPPIYELEVTAGNEPLSTHPQWVSLICGTPSAPLNGAQFVSYDKTGANYNPAPTGGNPGTFDPTSAVFFQWLGTDPATGKASIFTGVEDYLAAGSVYKKTYTTLSLPGDLSQVATFNVTPDGPVPDPGGDYDWFFMGETSTDNSGIFLNEATWKLVPTGPAAEIIYGGS